MVEVDHGLTLIGPDGPLTLLDAFEGRRLLIAYFAVFAQGPYPDSRRYRDFMGWQLPWYSAEGAAPELLTGRQVGLFHLVC
jgi:predicted dithiol-disulfide oxidoreductase (DUF899 family)